MLNTTMENKKQHFLIFRSLSRSSSPEVFLGKEFLKYGANLQKNTRAKVWFQITFPHGCFPVNFLHFFRISLHKSTSGGLLLSFLKSWSQMVYWNIVYCAHDFRKEIDILVKVMFLLSIKIFNMMKILSVLQVAADKIMFKESRKVR